MKPNKVLGKRRVALLIIDMINSFDFPEAEKLVAQTRKIAKNIRQLKARLKKHRVPIIYLNDNFGQWRSDWKEVFALCMKPGSLGQDIAMILQPDDDDYFVLKPRHSGFYCTSLDILLKDLGVQKLIITGVAGNICVLFTAHDAHMRDFEVCIPEDCTASNSIIENKIALRQMEKALSIKIIKSHSTVRL